MKVTNYHVYDIAESIVASGYPMRTDFTQLKIDTEIAYVRNYIKCLLKGMTTEQADEAAASYLQGEALERTQRHIKRAFKLAKNKVGSGHNNFISGIVVNFDLTAPRYFWNEFQRYHFLQIVSSSSQVHKLTSFDLEQVPDLTEEVWRNAESLIEQYKKEAITWDELVANMPQGIELTARISTNYLQLKTVYNQRKNHRSKHWKEFCEWIKTLPLAKELIING